MKQTTDKFEFESHPNYFTNDGYQVHLIAVVTFKSGFEKIEIKSVINTVCENYIGSITLLEALDLVGEGISELRELINEKFGNSPVTSFVIRTLDAVEKEEQISIELDPELENQGKKKGLLGRIKSKLFGN